MRKPTSACWKPPANEFWRTVLIIIYTRLNTSRDTPMRIGDRWFYQLKYVLIREISRYMYKRALSTKQWFERVFADSVIVSCARHEHDSNDRFSGRTLLLITARLASLWGGSWSFNVCTSWNDCYRSDHAAACYERRESLTRRDARLQVTNNSYHSI